MARDVEKFLQEQKISSPTLIGHSMGAKVAMTMALRRPGSYSALIPVDNAPVDAALRSDFGNYVRGMREIEDARPPVLRQSDADKILLKYEPDMAIRQFLLTNLVKIPASSSSSSSSGSATGAGANAGGSHEQRSHGTSSPAASSSLARPPETQLRFRIPLSTLAKSLDNMADFPFKDPSTHQYKGPTLVVRGIKSHYVADETLPAVGAFFPRFELLDVDSGHWVMSEKFEDFRQGVGDFVSRVVDEQ